MSPYRLQDFLRQPTHASTITPGRIYASMYNSRPDAVAAASKLLNECAPHMGIRVLDGTGLPVWSSDRPWQ